MTNGKFYSPVRGYHQPDWRNKLEGIDLGIHSRLPRHRWISRFNQAVLSFLLIMVLYPAVGWTRAEPEQSDPVAALRSQYQALSDQFKDNQFHEPLYLHSNETEDKLTGDIHALIDHPFSTVAAMLAKAENWCDILILHPNTKYCRAAPAEPATDIAVYVGRKYDQPLEEASRVNFKYKLAEKNSDYLQVQLHADAGPLGTHDYRIMIEAVAMDDKRTLIHFAYSYSYGLMSRLAMQTYLGTVGRDKVGFTITGHQADGQPIYVKGMRGVVERNTMRYYLALESFFDTAAVPAPDRLEKRLSDWFAASAVYSKQLHEMERDEYLEMKRSEYRRQSETQ